MFRRSKPQNTVKIVWTSPKSHREKNSSEETERELVNWSKCHVSLCTSFAQLPSIIYCSANALLLSRWPWLSSVPFVASYSCLLAILSGFFYLISFCPSMDALDPNECELSTHNKHTIDFKISNIIPIPMSLYNTRLRQEKILCSRRHFSYSSSFSHLIKFK